MSDQISHNYRCFA